MLSLRGFVYDKLANTEVTVRERMSWLDRDFRGYSPQLYDQLAASYRRDGNEEAARKVVVAKQRLRAPGPRVATHWQIAPLPHGRTALGTLLI